MNRELQRWFQALAIAVLFILVKGYTFNTGDQAEHLPQVYQMLDQELYPHDYFVQETNQIFTVRYYYEWLISGGAKIMPVATWCFLLMLFFTTVMAYSIQRIYETLFPAQKLSWLASILVLIVFNSWTVGGNGLFGNSLICSLIAKSAATFGLWRFLKGDVIGSGVSLAFAVIFQPLVGLQLMMVQGFSLLLRQKWKEIVILGLSYAILASPMIVPLLTRQAAISGDEPQMFWDVMYRFRNYLHYLPGLFPTTHFVKSAIMLMTGVGALLFFDSSKKRIVLEMAAAIVLGLIVYTVCLELLGLNAIGKTQWFKTTIWIALFGGVGVTALISGVIPIKRNLPSGLTSWLKPAFVFIGLVVIANSALVPFLPNRLMIRNYVKTDQEKMYEWISLNTEKDAVFLVPPDDYGFQCQAKRSIPIGFKAIIHEPQFMIAWYEEFQRIYGVGMDDLDGRKTEVIATEAYNSIKFSEPNSRIDYRLDDASQCQFLDELGPFVHSEGDWILTEFQSE